MRIRAWAVREKGGIVELFSYDRELGAHDVLVRITHRSIARGDIQFIDNDWGDTRYPLVPGTEIVGFVQETGAEVADLQKGDRVGVGFQQTACFACSLCARGTEQFCPEQKAIAVDCPGGLAEHIVVDGRFAFPLPPNLDSAASTPLLCAGLTVYAGIVHAGLPENSRVAVLGVGGLGHLAIQFLRAMGHRVSAFSHSPAKREMIERLGGAFIDGSDPQSLAGHNGDFDLILSTLNVPFDLDAHVRMLAPEGKLCLVASPERLSLDPSPLHNYTRRTVYGSYVGSRADTRDMLDFAVKHRIEAIVDTMPLSRMNEAIDRVRRRDVPMTLVLESQGHCSW